MKKLIVLTLAFILALPILTYAGDVRVRGYWSDRNGDGVKEYTQPYHRTTPDNNLYNNYSSQGQTNPWTGQRGTVNPNINPNPLHQPRYR